MSSVVNILEAVVSEVDAGRRVVVCAIVATRGSTPQPIGTVVCIDENARVFGSLGGGCVEADVRRQAFGLLTGETGKLLTFALDGDFGYDDGMICGGQMDVAAGVISRPDQIESIRRALELLRQGKSAVFELEVTTTDGRVTYPLTVQSTPTLLIVGAGHISKVLAGLAVSVGFDVTVLDDRADYANSDRFAPPIKTVVGDIGATLSARPIDPNTYIVIVTRGHKHDEQALFAVLESPARYIGMIGSRRKTAVIFDDLRHRGVDKRRLDRVHAPIGLAIGAVSTEEIAVSIVAQLVSVRRQSDAAIIKDPGPSPSSTT